MLALGENMTAGKAATVADGCSSKAMAAAHHCISASVHVRIGVHSRVQLFTPCH
jgi:hypothetical protein